MFKFPCKDVGADCNFVATGKTVDEVKKKAFDHAAVVHADIMKGMLDAQRPEPAKNVAAQIKPA